ncbi:hypothetical protein ES705_25775 [subsurface metagenome]
MSAVPEVEYKVIGRMPSGEANLLQTPEGNIVERIATGKQKGWWKVIIGKTEYVGKTPQRAIEIARERGAIPKAMPVAEAKPPAVEVERIAKIKYFRGEETKWREAAYKIAEEERGEAPFAEAIRKADEFGVKASELEAAGELLECMICHQKFDHLILGTCESCYKKWTGGK